MKAFKKKRADHSAVIGFAIGILIALVVIYLVLRLLFDFTSYLLTPAVYLWGVLTLNAMTSIPLFTLYRRVEKNQGWPPRGRLRLSMICILVSVFIGCAAYGIFVFIMPFLDAGWLSLAVNEWIVWTYIGILALYLLGGVIATLYLFSHATEFQTVMRRKASVAASSGTERDAKN